MVQRPAPPLPPTVAEAAAVTIARPTLVAATGPYGITPERRALLNTIRFAEGTWIGGSQEGYRVLYGGDRFGDLSRHPDIVVRRRYASAAAGAYQFLPTTWDRAAGELKLRDFRPASQDQAALHLVQARGALQSFDRQGLTAEVLARLAPEWASLPTLDGVSQYGQPVKDRGELQRFYQRELDRLRRLTRA
ncbi:glycoside hydrolase family 104 protein [Synechococcus sp. BA-132 BA5]|nr:glycoside hydrolase family 104 protein [Synechococcus sp. BA-132 BA5]MEA5416057.1 glycoside hydrolase family 104 protein [Synechococcus sp. BA-132 BA5]